MSEVQLINKNTYYDWKNKLCKIPDQSGIEEVSQCPLPEEDPSIIYNSWFGPIPIYEIKLEMVFESENSCDYLFSWERSNDQAVFTQSSIEELNIHNYPVAGAKIMVENNMLPVLEEEVALIVQVSGQKMNGQFAPLGTCFFIQF